MNKTISPRIKTHTDDGEWIRPSDTYIKGVKWFPIPGFTQYLITRDGHVISNVGNRPIFISLNPNKKRMNQIRMGIVPDDPKKMINFLNKGKTVNRSLHQWVAYTFLDYKFEMSITHEIDHIDGDRLNNSIWNLQVLTKEEHYLKGRKSPEYRAKSRPREYVDLPLDVEGRSSICDVVSKCIII